MKKTRTLLTVAIATLTLAVSTLTAQAASIDQQTARQRAADFLKGNSTMRHKRATGTATDRAVPPEDLTPVDIRTSLFAFNIGKQDGFVIVSPDDRTAPVLAYATAGHLDPETMPEAMRDWFQEYASQLAYLAAHPFSVGGGSVAASTPLTAADDEPTAKNPISALLTTMWNQFAPYNRLCPTTDKGDRCVTGCVATAMAQVMRFHQWPDSTAATIPGYVTASNHLTIDSIPAGLALDWQNMTDIYQGDESEEQLAAISSLMLAAGASVTMDYGTKKSDALFKSVPAALQTYFNYSPRIHYEYRGNYSIDDWEQLIYTELLAGRPILYQGRSSGGGHAFVVDGYSSNGYFHINWGWGNDNSQTECLLSVLNPGNNAGAGASTSLDGYSFDQAAILGIRPPRENDTPYSSFFLTTAITEIKGNDIVCEYINQTATTGTYDYGIGYYSPERQNFRSVSNNERTFSPTDDWQLTFTVNNLEPGTYHIVPISKLVSERIWRSSQNPNVDYVEAVVDEGGNITLTRHQPVYDISAQVEVNGIHLTNRPHTIKVTVNNNGDEYYDRIFLRINREGQTPVLLGSAGITVRKGNSTEIEFNYTPKEEGTFCFSAATSASANAEVIGQTTATFWEFPPNGGPINDSIHLQTEIAFEPVTQDGAYILSERPRIRITVTNPTDTNYDGSVQFTLFITDKNGDSYYKVYPKSTQAVPYKLGSHSEETFYLDERFHYANNKPYRDFADWLGTLEFDNAYCLVPDFRFEKYFRDVYSLPVTKMQIAAPPVHMYRADGYSLAELSRDTLTVPARAAAVDLRQATHTKVVKGGNPNTLYFVNKDAEVPDGITRNIVRGRQADTIRLDDGYNFYIPGDIGSVQANHVSYTRTFRRGYKSATQDGWNTMTLPFAVQKVQVLEEDQTRDIDWTRASGDYRDFWIMEFKGDQGNTLFFEPATDFVANRPYLVAVRQSTYPILNLTGKPFTFSADNVKLEAGATATTTGTQFLLQGLRYYQELDTIFALDGTGRQFELEDTAIQAFRAYFAIRDTATYNFKQNQLTIFINAQFDAIQDVGIDAEATRQEQKWYTATGQRIATPQRKGIFIRRGRKYIIK